MDVSCKNIAVIEPAGDDGVSSAWRRWARCRTWGRGGLAGEPDLTTRLCQLACGEQGGAWQSLATYMGGGVVKGQCVRNGGLNSNYLASALA